MGGIFTMIAINKHCHRGAEGDGEMGSSVTGVHEKTQLFSRMQVMRVIVLRMQLVGRMAGEW